MSDTQDIRRRLDHLAQTLDRLARDQETLCGQIHAGGLDPDAAPGLAELEDVRQTAETIKVELAARRHKGKLDPEVRDLENKLDKVLTRYYWLWQKCKNNMA